MKKSTVTLLVFTVFAVLNSSSLLAQNCTANATIDLDVNNVRASFKQGGRFWFDGEEPGYAVPKDHPDNVMALFAGSLWLGGIDPGGNLQIATQTYGLGTADSGNSGPLIDGAPDATVCQNFDRFWEVTLDEVQGHISDFNDNGVIDNPITNIMAWPGNDNPESEAVNGFALPQNKILAPYVDVDSDGIYDPMSGDYPQIKGEKSIWWSFHYYSATNVTPSVSCYVMAYAASSSNESVNNATFYDVKFVHDGLFDINDFYVGLWMDPDLGCYTDDYVGCYPEENFAFVYNMDAQDGTVGCSCEGGVGTYCDEIPVLSIKMLSGLKSSTDGSDLGMSSFIAYNNPSSNPPPGTTDPNTNLEFYNLLKGVWRDGTPITTGGNGYQSGGVETKYIFPDNPADANGWSMCSESIASTDVRMLMSSGPTTLQPGAVNEISFAVVWVGNQAYPCPDIQPTVAAGQQAAQFSLLQTTNETEVLLQTGALTASPNPMEEKAVLRSNGQALINSLELASIEGKQVRSFLQVEAQEVTILKSGLPSGIYVYRASMSDGSIATGKLVVK